MNRVKNIQRLINLSSVNKRSGDPDIKLSSVFYSITEDDIVHRNTDIIQSVVSLPKYIICFLLVPYRSQYGSYQKEELVAFTDYEGNAISKITLSNWNILNLQLRSPENISSITISKESNVPIILDFDGVPALSVVSDFWNIVREIDLSCTTEREAYSYLDYYQAKKKLNSAELSISDYQNKISEQANLLNQYKALIQKFQEIVEGSK